MASPIPLSVLDLAPVPEGTPPSFAARRTVDLARIAERRGYVRYWFAEHHSMPSVASSAPEVLIGHIASATTRIRVGSGGIMLPNHAPLRVAEAFHTLAALHPGRIDLGIGRAPGSEAGSSRALRAFNGEQFSPLMSELLFLSQARFSPGHPLAKVRVMPDDVRLPPVWILGSSGASAAAAGASGFGYAFASHFSPEPAAPAVAAYKSSFDASDQFPRPHAIVAVGVICAPTEAEAQDMAMSMELVWLRMSRGEHLPLPSPEEAKAYPWTEAERLAVQRMRGPAVVGTPAQVRAGLEAMRNESDADELMIVTNTWNHESRLRSYELVADVFDT
ncbi:MAG: class flavin-dependent oxidoreductase [Panacagrimonas sp.]|jgi:luciferase family oxidoreductase group 1|nr:LLM class flavin-dependent oxidoreductase [Panacagrimonas sp.]MCC2657298.1 class flavin-dependent oxidoreductase [Panacagrimonas sp.]